MSAAKLDEIGEQQPAKKAANCRQGGFNDQREPLAPVHPGDAVDSRQLIEQPHQLAHLTPTEVDRLDAQLGAFRGRIARDRIVEQADYLARGDIDGFEQRFGKL